MPTTLTLKGIPDDLYTRLKQTAEVHRRSLNSEAISVLETALLPRKASASDRIARARVLRGSLETRKFSAKDIDAFKRQGRR
jgi:plasmid stability protein